MVKGPPLSPWQESLPPSGNPAQNMLFVRPGTSAFVFLAKVIEVLHVSCSTTGSCTYFSLFVKIRRLPISVRPKPDTSLKANVEERLMVRKGQIRVSYGMGISTVRTKVTNLKTLTFGALQNVPSGCFFTPSCQCRMWHPLLAGILA